jgi:hypothetical protein
MFQGIGCRNRLLEHTTSEMKEMEEFLQGKGNKRNTINNI